MTTASPSAYAEFLHRKRRRAPEVGVHIRDSDMHPALRPHQAAGIRWAGGVGRAALWWDCGMGKTLAQVEWARLAGRRALIVAPLSVARQTVNEARMIDVDVRYIREPSGGPGVFITNYEMVHRVAPESFDAVVLDESSILKNVDGRTRRVITEAFSRTPMRLACSATPAPNDVAELTNHSAFLGVMSREEMLAAYFVHDEKHWRMKGHAAGAMFSWMRTWAQTARRPSDIGYDDDGYNLPDLRITQIVASSDITPGDGQLFATDLGGVGRRAQVRRETLDARTEAACELAGRPGQWIVWCGLNDESTACAAGIAGAVDVPGSWEPERKAEALEAFQDGSIRVLVTKPSIAGFGMNFQNAHQMVFVGLSDSYESYYQAIRRCWRYGQTEPVDVHIVTSELEQQIVENVKRKEQEASQWADMMISQA